MTQAVPASLDRVPIKEAISFGWRKTKQYFWPLLGAGIFIFFLELILAVPSMMHRHLGENSQDLSTAAMWFIFLGVVQVANMVISSIVSLGFINMLFKGRDDTQMEFKDLFAPAYEWMWLKYLVGTYVMALIVGLGFLLFVIPGIILGLKLQFFMYFILDKRMGPIQALKASWNVTRGVKMDLFLLGLSNLGILILGVLALGVGWVPALMITNFAYVFVYQRLVQTAPEGSF